MLKLNRGSVGTPQSLQTTNGAVASHKAKALNYYQARNPWHSKDVSYKFKGYDSDDVKNALLQLTSAKCAYCESKMLGVGAREVEHYRPKGGVDGESGWAGYWWLAYEWSNLLPTCRDCNKSLRQHIVTSSMTEIQVLALFAKKNSISYGKANQFKLLGTRAFTENCDTDLEDPLLIDPCKKDPAEHLIWDFSNDLALIQPKSLAGSPSAYGEYTISTCALNRAPLVIDRISVLRPLRVQRTKILEELEASRGDPKLVDAALRRARDLQSFADKDAAYSQMVASFINAFVKELDGWLAKHS